MPQDVYYLERFRKTDDGSLEMTIILFNKQNTGWVLSAEAQLQASGVVLEAKLTLVSVSIYRRNLSR